MMLGDVVRTLRLQRNWKQQELARQTGLDQGTISNIERGKQQNPTHDTIARLATALEFPVDQLARSISEHIELSAGSSYPAGRAEKDLARVQRIWQRLPANDRAVLVRVAEALDCKQAEA